MKLECVIVCVDYSDFLSETLPLNKPQFDRIVVVTSKEDTKTQHLCDYHHVKWVTADFGPPGEFRKGEAINVGLAELSQDDWVVHMDADIVLPPQFRFILEGLTLDIWMIYGIDRFLIPSYKAWRKQQSAPVKINEMNTYIHTEAFPIATRFMSDPHGGYLPIGFFQMWNPRVSGNHHYPTNHSTAGRTDMLFAAQWPRVYRGFLPEIVAFHLESEVVPQGTNWNGRKTRPFRPLTFSEWFKQCLPYRKGKKKHPELPPPSYEV